MGRPALQEQITRELELYLAHAEAQPPADFPLSIRAVARAIGRSPTSLYRYGLDRRIAVARRRQAAQASASPAALERLAYGERLESLQEQLKEAEGRVRHLIGLVGLIESNAARLGIDPEDLYRPSPKPDRRSSRAAWKRRPR